MIMHLAINQTLATLGQVTGVDRVYIFEVHPHPEIAEPTQGHLFTRCFPRLTDACFGLVNGAKKLT